VEAIPVRCFFSKHIEDTGVVMALDSKVKEEEAILWVPPCEAYPGF
jgi:hypothetical protein